MAPSCGPSSPNARRRRAARGTPPALIDGKPGGGETITLVNPSNESQVIGTVVQATAADAERAISSAHTAQPAWDALGADKRAAILLKVADAFEAHRGEFFARCTLEAGKTLADGVAEVREAVDFLRYYALQARSEFGGERVLVGPTGERNSLRLRGRGVFACISPWNFPLAIFTGQVAAALAAGNAVIAKPAEQTPLTAALAIQLMHAAGVPRSGVAVPAGRRWHGRCSTDEGQAPRRSLTGSNRYSPTDRTQSCCPQRQHPTLIAETGRPLNAMIVDSSALPEQVVLDAVSSGLNSAGRARRCACCCFSRRLPPRARPAAGYMEELRIATRRYCRPTSALLLTVMR